MKYSSGPQVPTMPKDGSDSVEVRSRAGAAFDADLKRRDPRWGVRDVDDLVGEAAPHGLELREIVEMPVNNLSLVFVKAGPPVPA